MMAEDLRSFRLLGDFKEWHLISGSSLALSMEEFEGDLGGVLRS